MSSKAEIIKIYKNPGETPLECLKRFREENPLYEWVKMTYLGRLDPMAEGIMLVLAGNTKDKEQYLNLDKTYEFEVLWGVETDTYDALGIITATGKLPQKLDLKMDNLLKHVLGKKTQVYPPYSSRTVGGKSLFEWARANKIEEVDVPVRGIKVFDIKHVHTRLITGQEILDEVTARICEVGGDFRQKEIINTWKGALVGKLDEQYMLSRFVADVSSGTYIRGLAHEMGRKLDTCAIAYSIKRTRVGEYRV